MCWGFSEVLREHQTCRGQQGQAQPHPHPWEARGTVWSPAGVAGAFLPRPSPLRSPQGSWPSACAVTLGVSFVVTKVTKAVPHQRPEPSGSGFQAGGEDSGSPGARAPETLQPRGRSRGPEAGTCASISQFGAPSQASNHRLSCRPGSLGGWRTRGPGGGGRLMDEGSHS